MDDEIETLDLDDDIIVYKKEKEEPKKVVNNNNNNNNIVKKDTQKKAKKKIKKSVVRKTQIIFCSLSALFILGCCIFYGLRFVKYYRIYNPKVEANGEGVFLANYIIGQTEYATGDEPGLFSSSGNYIYKGNVDNNYVKYNNMLWRIVRINSDKSIDIILDDYISILPWNSGVKSFSESEIFKYLNNEFLNNFDKDLLTTVSFCTNEITELTKITCESQDSDHFVKLLDVTNFLNSVKNSKSYLVKDDEIMWLSDYGNEKVWHTNGVNVSESEANTFYEVKPVIRLKEINIYKAGDGTLNNPYIVGDNEKLTIGSEVQLGDDKWIVYDMSKNIRLMKKKVIEKQLDFDKEKLTYNDSSLMKYLNTTYLESLSYKDLLIDDDWYIGEYKDSLNDIKSDNVKAKIGIPNILDIKFDSNISGYFTSTIKEERVLVYENPLRPSKTTTYRSIRPCISISKDSISKLKYDKGIFKVGE